MKSLILNRDFRHPTDGFYQLMPFGEFPADLDEVVDGKVVTREVVQVCDIQSGQAIANRFQAAAAAAGFPGMLVDYDHFSLDKAKESIAAGWITEMVNRDDGLYGRIRWTASGQPKVDGGDYRFLSPVFDPALCEDLGGNRLRPLDMLLSALTNDHNMKTMKPLTNRAAGAPESGTETKPQQQERNAQMMTKLLPVLALVATASEDDVVAAVQKLVNRSKEADGLQAKVTALEKADLERQVEADLEKFAPVIQNRDEVKQQLLTNREGTLKILRAMKPQSATTDNTNGSKTLPNRRTATAPTGGAEDTDDPAAQQRAAKIRNRSVELRAAKPTLSRSRAWAQAAAEIGEA